MNRAGQVVAAVVAHLGDAALALGVAAGGIGVLVACKNGLADDHAPAAPPVTAVRSSKPPGERSAVAPAGLCFTLGSRKADGDRGLVRIDEPKVRAVALGSHGDAAELQFTYLGDTEEQAALASGQIRRQLGLKLRAADGCNLVYVMWRLDPAPMIEVSTKVNPGAHDHGDCGTRGYAKLKAQRSEPPPALVDGAAHTLTAEIVDEILIARVDDHVVWRGALDARARTLQGPAGLRTDNVRLSAALHVAAADPAVPPSEIPGCD